MYTKQCAQTLDRYIDQEMNRKNVSFEAFLESSDVQLSMTLIMISSYDQIDHDNVCR